MGMGITRKFGDGNGKECMATDCMGMGRNVCVKNPFPVISTTDC